MIWWCYSSVLWLRYTLFNSILFIYYIVCLPNSLLTQLSVPPIPFWQVRVQLIFTNAGIEEKIGPAFNVQPGFLYTKSVGWPSVGWHFDWFIRLWISFVSADKITWEVEVGQSWAMNFKFGLPDSTWTCSKTLRQLLLRPRVLEVSPSGSTKFRSKFWVAILICFVGALLETNLGWLF